MKNWRDRDVSQAGWVAQVASLFTWHCPAYPSTRPVRAYLKIFKFGDATRMRQHMNGLV